MFLSGKWIEENGPKIINPFHVDQIDCSAYTMRIGSEVYVSPDKIDGREASLIQLNREQEIFIPPGQFAFLISREWLNVPVELMAFINLRTKLKSRGLINVSGFHVDPGYSGRLIFSVFNAGVQTVKLRENDEALLIWFARLEDPDARYAKSSPGFKRIESDLMASLPATGASIGSVSMRLSRVEDQLSAYRKIAGLIITLMVGILASYPIWNHFNPQYKVEQSEK
jgi:dCTP deaminase